MSIGGSAVWTLNPGGPILGTPTQVIEVARAPEDAVPFVVSLAPIERMQVKGGTGGPSNAGPIDLNTMWDSRAVVEWGSGGARQVATIDWPARGGTFGVHGSYLAVGAMASPLAIPSTGGNTQNVRFTATASIAAGSGYKPTRSVVLGSVPGESDSGVFDVPAFATGVTLYYQVVEESLLQTLPFDVRRVYITWVNSVPSQMVTRYGDGGKSAPLPASPTTIDANATQVADVPPQAQRFFLSNPDPDYGLFNVVVVFHLTLF